MKLMDLLDLLHLNKSLFFLKMEHDGNMMETWWKPHIDMSCLVYPSDPEAIGDEKIGMRGISGSDFIRFPAGLHDFGLIWWFGLVQCWTSHNMGCSLYLVQFRFLLKLKPYYCSLFFWANLVLLTHYNAKLTMPTTVSPQAVSEDAWALAWQLLVVCRRCVGPSSRSTQPGYLTVRHGIDGP